MTYKERYQESQRQLHSAEVATAILKKLSELGLTTVETHDALARKIERAMDGEDFLNSFYAAVPHMAWSCGADVQINLEQNPHGANGVRAKATIGWSSCHRSVSTALHAIINYSKAVDFAAFIEAYLQ